MKVKVLFFGVLSELCGASNLEMEAVDTASLTAALQTRFPEIKNHTFRLSLNQHFTTGNTVLSDGDEVAFLPPFAGG